MSSFLFLPLESIQNTSLAIRRVQASYSHSFGNV